LLLRHLLDLKVHKVLKVYLEQLALRAQLALKVLLDPKDRQALRVLRVLWGHKAQLVSTA
jgi:hypothetical protein